jgi:hypothetical protein
VAHCANRTALTIAWHKGFFAVEHRFARELAGLLIEEGFDVWDGRATVDGK